MLRFSAPAGPSRRSLPLLYAYRDLFAQILATSLKDFRQFADYLDATRGDRAKVVAVCSPDAAEKAAKKKPGLFDEVRRVL